MSDENTTWISEWHPEDEKFWNSGGKTIARRNLIWSIVAEHVGFSIWLIWSHRCDQAAGGGLPLHHRPIVSACSAARIDRLADAVSLHIRGRDLRRQELDDLQRFGAVHSSARTRLFRHPARHAVLGDALGIRDGRSRRRQFRLQHGQYLVLLSGSHEGLGARVERGRRQYRRQQRPIAGADLDGARHHQSLSGDASRAASICRMPG